MFCRLSSSDIPPFLTTINKVRSPSVHGLGVMKHLTPEGTNSESKCSPNSNSTVLKEDSDVPLVKITFQYDNHTLFPALSQEEESPEWERVCIPVIMHVYCKFTRVFHKAGSCNFLQDSKSADKIGTRCVNCFPACFRPTQGLYQFAD